MSDFRLTRDRELGPETQTLGQAVVLAKAAQEAGLIVTHLQPIACQAQDGSPCFAFQLWQPNGLLWAEARHEPNPMDHINAYKRYRKL